MSSSGRFLDYRRIGTVARHRLAKEFFAARERRPTIPLRLGIKNLRLRSIKLRLHTKPYD